MTVAHSNSPIYKAIPCILFIFGILQRILYTIHAYFLIPLFNNSEILRFK